MKNTSILIGGLLTGALLGAFGGAIAQAGDLERYCAFGIERWERWSGGGEAIPWQICSGPNDRQVLPRYPEYCLGTQQMSVDRPYRLPGVRSLLRATAEWAKCKTGLQSVDASTFSLSQTPGFVQQTDVNDGLMWLRQGFLAQPDGMNTVTAWEPNGYWLFFGGPTVLAATAVRVNAATGDILEVDIGLPALEENTIKGFLDYDSDFVSGSNIVYTSSLPSSPAMAPDVSVDLIGLMTHEFGHLAGLGHSMIDGRYDRAQEVSEIPTMFPLAQVSEPSSLGSPWAGLFSGCLAWGGFSDFFLINPVLGFSARTLEPDDVAAIGRGYPSTLFSASTGTITGFVERAETAEGVQGVTVVAIPTIAPEKGRVATMTYAQGEYVLSGLLPGDYYVFVEPLDQDPDFTGATGYYFSNFDVPQYPWLGNPFFGLDGCLSPGEAEPFAPELWNLNDSGPEASPSTATPITVQAGQAAMANFEVTSDPVLLTVVRTECWPAVGCVPMSSRNSPRGVVFNGVSQNPSGVRFFVPRYLAPDETTTNVWLFASQIRTGLMDGTQLRQVEQQSPTPLSLSPGGNSWQVDSGFTTTNTFYQARMDVLGPGSVFRRTVYSTPVNVLLLQ